MFDYQDVNIMSASIICLVTPVSSAYLYIYLLLIIKVRMSSGSPLFISEPDGTKYGARNKV